MAERRMFAKTIIDSDAFLDMGMSAQALYFHLAMRADDDGFVNNPKKIQRMVGGADDDLKILRAKRFIIAFESGIIVIKHWKIHNYIQNDRYRPTVYQSEKALLTEKPNKSYTEKGNDEADTLCIQHVSNLDAQDSIDKDSIVKDIIVPVKPSRKKFVPPSVDEVAEYCKERKNSINAENFVSFYMSKGWKIGKDPMVDWKASVRTWEHNEKTGGSKRKLNFQNYEQTNNANASQEKKVESELFEKLLKEARETQ